jgi:hypothetical protein
MNMQIETMNRASNALIDLGISGDAADKALLLLSADGADSEVVADRVNYLARLCQACGSLQNAKLAYSLAGRSEQPLNATSCELLAHALRCSECVPAAVRLWKKALEAQVDDYTFLVTAARLGEDGMEQIRVLNALKKQPELLEPAAELARRLQARGWECDGSWGAVNHPEYGAVWWDYAAPTQRRSYGMTLTTRPISLRNRLDTRLRFEVRHEILGTTDRCHLEVSLDGGKRWEKLVKFEGTADWTPREVDLSRFSEEEISLRFHVLSGGQREGRGIEISQLRLESVLVTRQQNLDFDELSDGWERDGPQGRANPTIVGSQSESTVVSVPFCVSNLTSPTVTLEARLQASSVYGEATVEVLSGPESVLVKESIAPSPDWLKLNLRLPNTLGQELTLRLWSRFAKRKDTDGFWVRSPRLRAGMEESRETIWLNGGYEDGVQEQKALLRLVEEGDLKKLERVQSLRRGLPSMKSALALSAMLRSEDQIPALLLLYSSLKEGAVVAFSTLGELAAGEDMLLQAQVLLKSGLDSYPSSRDHLGDGLLSPQEFEDNCRLYLQLREGWTEQESRKGLSLLLTPVAAEDASVRRKLFGDLLQQHSTAESFFAAWDKHWVE